MKTYICKERHSVITAKGIVGPPVNPDNPTEKEIITAKNFRNGQAAIDGLLSRKVNCPIVEFKIAKEADELIEDLKGKMATPEEIAAVSDLTPEQVKAEIEKEELGAKKAQGATKK